MSRSFFRLNCIALEAREVPAGFTLADDSLAIAPEDGGIPRVKIIDPKTGEDIAEVELYNLGFRGGVRAATGDVTGDGIKDLVTAAGPGGGPHIKVYDGATGTELRSFFAYVPEFRNGLSLTLGDVNRDGFDDIITAAGPGGGPNIRVFDGRTGTILNSFFAYDPGFTGGLNVASGDIDGDGRDDLIIGAGKNAGPHVRALSGRDDSELRSFFADDSSFTGGVRVSSFDVSGDGIDDILPRTRHGSDVAQFVFSDGSGISARSFIRKVDDNPSVNDLIEGLSENRGGGSSSGGSSNGGGSSSSGGNTSSGVTQVEGTISAVNVSGRTATFRFGNGSTRTVNIAPTAKIERNDLHATLDAFRLGDFGEAKIGADGIAFKVEAVG